MPQPRPVSVNGVVIARDAIAREVQHHRAGSPIEAWRAAARALVIRELLLQEARRLEITTVPLADDAGRQEAPDEALMRGLVEQEVTVPEPDEDSCRRYYDRNRKAFRSPTIYEAAHILFAARRGDADAFARAELQARSVLAELKRHPDRFAALARLHSACASATQGGALGQVTADQTTPEFAAALETLSAGCMSEAPVATRYGLHIIRLDRRIEGRELPFEIVADRIAEYLRESVMRRAVAQYIACLVSRSEIKGIAIEDAEAHRVN
jgi:peptidyl-prolyl cis-trans isomerase C